MPVKVFHKGRDFVQIRAWPGFNGGFHTDLPPTKIPDDAVWDSINIVYDRDCAAKRRGFRYLSTNTDNDPVRLIDQWNDTAGNQRLIIACNSHIYEYNLAGDEWVDISPPGGLNGIFSEGYSSQPFAGKYFLTNVIDAPCYWDGTGNFQWLDTPGAPKQARDVLAFANHLLWFNVVDATMGWQPQEVVWSDNKNGLEYANGDAGAAILEDTNDQIMAAELVTDYVAIAREYSIYLCSFVGFPFFYRFDRRVERFGTVATDTFLKTEIFILTLSRNNIITFDGANMNAFIGQPVIRDLYKIAPSNEKIGGSYAGYDLTANKWRLMISSREDGMTDTEYAYSTLYQNWSKHFLSLNGPVTAIGFIDFGYYPRWMDFTTTWQEESHRWDDPIGSLISPAMIYGDKDGDIYLADQGYNDGGFAIESFLKTKQTDMQMPGWVKELNRLQFIFDGVSHGTLTIHVYQSDDGFNYTEADNSPIDIVIDNNPTPFVDVFAVGVFFYLHIENNNLDEWFCIREIIATVIPLFEVDYRGF